MNFDHRPGNVEFVDRQQDDRASDSETTPGGRRPGSASSGLLSRVRASDAAAWKRLTDLYSPWVYSLARRGGVGESEAADISQEVFLVAATRIQSFRRDEPGQSMKKWLGHIARNKIGDWLRSQKHLPKPIGGEHAVVDQIAESDGHLRDGEDWDDESVLVRRAIELIRSDFSDSSWICFRRMVLEDCSAVEIAEDMQMSAKAVRQAKYRVLHRLREEFEGLIDWESPAASAIRDATQQG